MIHVSALVAHDMNNLIGVGSIIPWKMRDDLKLFKERTMGHYCIVGRKTFDAMPELKGRKFVVVSKSIAESGRNPYDEETTIIASSLKQAIILSKTGAYTEGQDEVFVIGGGEIYKDAMPHVTRVYATEIDAEVFPMDRKQAIYFPRLSWELWEEDREQRVSIKRDDRNAYNAEVKTYYRVG